MDFAHFGKNYKLITADLSKQKALDGDPRAIQQIIFTGKASENVVVSRTIKRNNTTIL